MIQAAAFLDAAGLAPVNLEAKPKPCFLRIVGSQHHVLIIRKSATDTAATTLDPLPETDSSLL